MSMVSEFNKYSNFIFFVYSVIRLCECLYLSFLIYFHGKGFPQIRFVDH